MFDTDQIAGALAPNPEDWPGDFRCIHAEKARTSSGSASEKGMILLIAAYGSLRDKGTNMRKELRALTGLAGQAPEDLDSRLEAGP